MENKSKIAINFYGSIILSIILHHFVVSGMMFHSTLKVAIDFLIFNILFGGLNIILKVEFK